MRIFNRNAIFIVTAMIALLCCMCIAASSNQYAEANDHEGQYNLSGDEVTNVENHSSTNYTSKESHDYVYVDYQGGHILSNESFVIPFKINSDKSIIKYIIHNQDLMYYHRKKSTINKLISN